VDSEKLYWVHTIKVHLYVITKMAEDHTISWFSNGHILFRWKPLWFLQKALKMLEFFIDNVPVFLFDMNLFWYQMWSGFCIRFWLYIQCTEYAGVLDSALIIRIYIQCTRELTVFPIANINTTNIHFSIDQLCLMREMDNRNCND
jgi:hypothetical protein